MKKAKLESATREVPDVGPTVCQGRGNRSNEIPWSPGDIEGAGGVSQYKSDTVFRAHESHTVGGSRTSDDYHNWQKKECYATLANVGLWMTILKSTPYLGKL